MDRKSLNIILISSIFFILIIIPSHIRPWAYPSDDAFFYLQIANNVTSGGGVTFSGITDTNGFHPLWLIVCMGASVLSGGNEYALLHIVLIIQQLMFVLMLYLIYKISLRFDDQFFFISFPVLGIYLLAIGNYASEAHINVLMHLITIFALFSFDFRKRAQSLLFGIILGLLFLARLDNIFLILVLMAYLGFGIKQKKINISNWLTAGLTASLVVFPYLLWNLLKFGHLVPISGAIKGIFPDMVFIPMSLGIFGIIISLFSILGLAYSIFSKNPLRLLIGLLSAASLIQSIYVIIFTDHMTNWSWYYVTGTVGLCFLLISVLTDLARVFNGMGKRVFGIMVTVAAIILSVTGVSRAWSELFNPETRGFNPIQFNSEVNCRWPVNVGWWLKSNLPADSRILIYEWPGMIAYFSGMKILPLDGLVNDFNYQEEVSRLEIVKYMQKKDIKYFLAPYEPYAQPLMGYENYSEGGRLKFRIYSSLYRKPVGIIDTGELKLICRFDDFIHCDGIPQIALWEVPESFYADDRN